MRTFACVLRTGGDYTEDHVRILKNQVERSFPSTERFVCLTNLPEIEGIETMPLIHNLPGKYSMQEIFRMKGQVVVTGLDTILFNNLDAIWDLECGNNDMYMIRAFRNPNRFFANGITYWNGDWEERLMKDPQKSTTYTLEQQYTAENLQACGAKIRLLNDTFRVVSYKKHLLNAKTKPDVDIIIFHGFPRPHQCETEWVKEAYK